MKRKDLFLLFDFFFFFFLNLQQFHIVLALSLFSVLPGQKFALSSKPIDTKMAPFLLHLVLSKLSTDLLTPCIDFGWHCNAIFCYTYIHIYIYIFAILGPHPWHM